jgi:hypothetical protein
MPEAGNCTWNNSLVGARVLSYLTRSPDDPITRFFPAPIAVSSANRLPRVQIAASGIAVLCQR